VARLKDEDKRQAIRDAVVAEVIKGGLSGTSVARIANRAGLSSGTIYLYYENKDQLLQQVYIEIKMLLHSQMMAAIEPAASTTRNLRCLWLSTIDFLVANPDKFLFCEFVSAAQVLDDSRQSELDVMANELSELIHQGIRAGVLRDEPISSIHAILMAPAMDLARQAILTRQSLNPTTVAATATQSAPIPAQAVCSKELPYTFAFRVRLSGSLSKFTRLTKGKHVHIVNHFHANRPSAF